MDRATFRKSERIVSQKTIDELFSGSNSCSRMAFPLRTVTMSRPRQEGAEPVEVLISVPKKRLRHAVDRNRVKRQLREAYRLNKHRLTSHVPADRQLALAFIWVADHCLSTNTISERMQRQLSIIADSL